MPRNKTHRLHRTRANRTKRKNRNNRNKRVGGWNETNFQAYKETPYGKITKIGEFEELLINDIRKGLINLLGENTPLPGYEQKTPTSISNHELKFSYDYRNLINSVPDFDDGDYSQLKWTKIKAGSVFYRRQQTKQFNRETWKDVWLNYSSRNNTRKSFLIEQLNENANNSRLKSTIGKFGPHLLKLKTTKDLLVIHLPDTITSYAEYYIRYFNYRTEYKMFLSVDGYTLDFLKFNPNPIYKELPSISGYRELKLHSTSALEVVE
jgi:hypothetical protein